MACKPPDLTSFRRLEALLRRMHAVAVAAFGPSESLRDAGSCKHPQQVASGIRIYW